MGLGASGFPMDLPSPGLMPLTDASQAPHQHAAATVGVASRLMLPRLPRACLFAGHVAPAHASPCVAIMEEVIRNAGR